MTYEHFLNISKNNTYFIRLCRDEGKEEWIEFYVYNQEDLDNVENFKYHLVNFKHYLNGKIIKENIICV